MFLKNLSALRKTPQGFLLLLRLFKKQHMSTKQTTTTTTKDSYFAAVYHISNIVRKDFYLERTLNKLNFPLTSDLVYRVLCASHNSPTESFRFFNWTQQQHPHYTPTTLEYEQLVKTLAKNKQFETMFKVLHQMGVRGLPFSPDTASFVIEQYGKHRLVDQAVGFFNGLGKLGCVQTVCVYNSLLFALCESRVFHGAYALVRRMIRKGLKPDKRSYAVLVNAWCSNGKMKEARAFLEEMSAKGFSPPVRGRDLLVEGLLNAGYVDCAKDMVRKMSKEGFVPDVDTFNVLVENVCSSNSGEGNEGVEFCVELFYNACKLGFCPDISTYKILVPAVSKVGKIDVAFRLLNNSVEDGHKPFPSLYAPIIKGLCKLGRFDDAFSFFSDMKIKGHPPNRPVYTMLITMCGRGGRYVDAANYLMEMTELGLTPISRCFDMVADGLKNCGKHDLARRIEQLEVNLRGV